MLAATSHDQDINIASIFYVRPGSKLTLAALCGPDGGRGSRLRGRSKEGMAW